MFPTIPDNLHSLSSKDLRKLAEDIRLAAKAVLDGTPDADAIAQVQEFMGKRKDILSVAREIEIREQLEAEVADDSEAPVDEPEVVEEPTEVAPEVAAPVEEPVASENPEREPVAAAAAAVRTSVGMASKPESGKRITPNALVARDGLKSVRAGETFQSWTQLAEAVVEKAQSIRGNSSEKFEVAAIPGNFPQNRVLTDDPVWNLRLFDQDEIMAAMCAPLEPIYTITGANTDRRPVANSLPGFQAPRGGVTIYPSPSLSDITTGVGVWTNADDSNPSAVKEACQTIECATPTEYRIYGVYKCLTVKNLLAITYPELVEAYLNRLHAAHARVAEIQLLEAMANGATVVTAPALGYNATVHVTSSILNLLALWQEIERWDLPGLMEAWMPRWVLYAVKMDMIRRRRTDGARVSVPSDAEVAGLFREVGVNPHFVLDTPSWATPVPSVASGGVLNLMPSSLEILIAPPGKFALMDRGELAIGVTGNNIYRDNVSNSRNEFTFFFENFEGVVDTNSLPAYLLELPTLCWNGIQIADVVIDCEGNDYANVGSGS